MNKSEVNNIVIDKGESFTVERKWVLVGAINAIVVAFSMFMWVASIESDLDAFKQLSQLATRDRITKAETMTEIHNINKRLDDIANRQATLYASLKDQYTITVKTSEKCFYLEKVYDELRRQRK
jgi:hypothetical protein